MNYSKQREVILKTLREHPVHPTADELYAVLKSEIPSISLATVYRNLNLLAEKGIIKKIECLCGSSHFDHNIHRHYHFICNKCNKIYDISGDVAGDIEMNASAATGLEITDHDISFRGICTACQHKN